MKVCRPITHSKVYKKNCHSSNSSHTLSISLYYNSETFPVQIAGVTVKGKLTTTLQLLANSFF